MHGSLKSFSAILFVLVVLMFSCEEIPPPGPDPDPGNNGDKDVLVWMETLAIAGKEVDLADPALTLEAAFSKNLNLSFYEAKGAAVNVTLSSDAADFMYGIMACDSDTPVWRSSGPLDFSNNDIFAVRVISGKCILYYKFVIAVSPKPPLDEFKQKYMTFIDSGIPAMYITTQNNAPVTSKDIFIQGTITITGAGSNNLSAEPMQIKGRGNSTWDMPKKPYRIRFDSKLNLFGRKNVRNWALLANYADKSLIRNYMVHMLDRSMGRLDYSPNVIPIEVHFNGRYDGLYCLQDHQEANPARVNVEGFTTDAIGKLSDVGFYVELDWTSRNPGCVLNRDYFTVGTLNWFLKYPQYGDTGFEELAFHRQAVDNIRTYVTNVHNAITARNMATFDSLCSRDTFIDYTIIQEFSKNVDGAQLSVHLSKKMGQKMQMGPLWDFDLSLGNADYISYTSDAWYIVPKNGGQSLPWYRSLMIDNGYYEDFRTRYLDIAVKNIKYAGDCIDIVREAFRPAAIRNFERWPRLGIYDWPNPPPVVACKTWDANVDYVKNFWTARNIWLYDQLYNRRAISGVR